MSTACWKTRPAAIVTSRKQERYSPCPRKAGRLRSPRRGQRASSSRKPGQASWLTIQAVRDEPQLSACNRPGFSVPASLACQLPCTHLHLERAEARLSDSAVGHGGRSPRGRGHESLSRRSGDERQGDRSQHLCLPKARTITTVTRVGSAPSSAGNRMRASRLDPQRYKAPFPSSRRRWAALGHCRGGQRRPCSPGGQPLP